MRPETQPSPSFPSCRPCRAFRSPSPSRSRAVGLSFGRSFRDSPGPYRFLKPSVLFLCVVAAACAPEYTLHGTLVDAPEGPRNVRAIERIRASSDGRCARRIGLLSDPQTDYSGLRKAVRALEREEDVDFYVVVGDIADNGFAWEFDRMNAWLDTLSRPVLVIAGNHDLLGNGRSLFSEAYGPKDFVLDLPPYRFISWNNNRLEHGGRSRMPGLRRLLASPPADGIRSTLLFSHIPRAQASEHVWPAAERAEYCHYLKDTPITLALHGHLHAWGFVRSDCGQELVVGRVDEAGHYGTLDLRCDGSWTSRRCVAGRECREAWSSLQGEGGADEG